MSVLSILFDALFVFLPLTTMAGMISGSFSMCRAQFSPQNRVWNYIGAIIAFVLAVNALVFWLLLFFKMK